MSAELPALHGRAERLPLIEREREHRTARLLGVPNGDDTPQVICDLTEELTVQIEDAERAEAEALAARKSFGRNAGLNG